MEKSKTQLYDILESFRSSRSVEDTCCSLKQFLKLLEETIDSKMRKNLVSLFVEGLRNSVSAILLGLMISSKHRFKIVEVEHSAKFLVANMALCLGDNPGIKITKSIIKDLISLFENELISPQTSTLNPSEIIDLLNLCQVKYNLIDIITARRPLIVIQFEKTHVSNNALYWPSINTIATFALNSSRCPEGDCGLDYIFLHELGHSLQYSLTKNISKIPESFYSVFETTFGNKRANVTDEDFLEVFADSFATAAANSTDFEKGNPFFKVFSKFSVAGLSLYFSELTQAAFEHRNSLRSNTFDLDHCDLDNLK